MFNRSIFIFRRDLRFADNTGLIRALKEAREVLPIFIFDPRQIQKHDYRSENGLRFMLKSLVDLQEQLKIQGGELKFFWGNPVEVISRLQQSEQFDAIYLNRDYTPFALERDGQIKIAAEKLGLKYFEFDDALLHAPGTVLKSDGSAYVVYSAYYKAALKRLSIEHPDYQTGGSFYKEKLTEEVSLEDPRLETAENEFLNPKGGRAEALAILKKIVSYKNYQQERDFPALDATTKLSAHNKFGTVSAREVYWQVAKNLSSDHTLIRELYWRDFFTQISFFFPRVFKGSFNMQYDRLSWSENEEHWLAWKEGLTGYPIVDAGMRELKATGYMHNRVRMIVASFLTKDLHISWQWGEKYFAQKLVDYDPAVNNGNWQWASSTGCDAQPYFRIFNPWLQQVKFDAKAEYIKRWVPELVDVATREIHRLEAVEARSLRGYPAPIVEHNLERNEALERYGMVREVV